MWAQGAKTNTDEGGVILLEEEARGKERKIGERGREEFS